MTSLYFFFSLFCVEVQAEDPPTLQALHTDLPNFIDGKLLEEVWQTPGFSGFIQSEPDDGARASEQTFVWIAYDEENLYVAARLSI